MDILTIILYYCLHQSLHFFKRKFQFNVLFIYKKCHIFQNLCQWPISLSMFEKLRKCVVPCGIKYMNKVKYGFITMCTAKAICSLF